MTAEQARQLDDPHTYERLDPDGMGSLIAAFGDQMREAWAVGRDWEPPASMTTPSRVVIVGMGGSAIGADIASTIARLTSPIAVEVIRNYLPPPTAEGTLVIASSVSGNTEETLEAFEQTRNGPAMRLAITTGGKLAATDAPSIQYRWDHHPRAALGWGLLPLAAALTRLGVLSISDDEIAATATAIDTDAASYGVTVSADDNPAKQIAMRLNGTLPVFAGTDWLEVAARRWAGQAQENAKQWAFAAALPELDHNFLNGFGLPTPGTDRLHVLFLDTPNAHDRNRRRVTLTGQALDEARVAHSTEVTDGAGPLQTILRTCHLGDWVSYYLAMLNEVDPSDTSPIETFKQRMG